MELIGPTVVAGVLAGVAVALIGLAIIGHLVQRSRARAEARLDDISGRVLRTALALSEQTKADGCEARLRLLRAAHAAMSEQQGPPAASRVHRR